MNRFNIKSKTYYLYHVVLTHISGITYYLSATINPILYQVMSRKFRIAFKDTFGYCLPCLRSNLPEITYSTIVGGVSSYKLSRTGSFYSNGSFRRSSINFEEFPTPIEYHKNSDTTQQPLVTSVTVKSDSDTVSAAAVVTGVASKVAEYTLINQIDNQSPNMESNGEQILMANKEKSTFLNVPSFKF